MARHVQLLFGNGFDAVWTATRPWFEQAAQQAFLTKQPWVVLTPSRNAGHAIKDRLLKEGLNLGGVFFWTPGEMRDHLRHNTANAPTLAIREHLHLLLAAAAESIEQAPREPARLLRALDRLHAAGFSEKALDFKPAEALAHQLRIDLEAAGWTTTQEFDWRMAKQPPANAIQALLVWGFDAAHWEYWPLLLASVQAAAQSTVVLTPPRSKAEELDQLWIGSWEQYFGEGETIASTQTTTPFAELAQRMENPESVAQAKGTQKPLLRIGRTVREQAEAIVAQALSFATEPEATRIGVLFPSRGPLAREVSAQLLRHGIPHFDSFGHTAPPAALTLRWKAWTALQRTATIDTLQRLLQLDPQAARPDTFLNELDRARGDVLVDDLPVIHARLVDMGRPNSLAAAQLLEKYERLPTRGILRELADATLCAWRELGWDESANALANELSAVATLMQQSVSLSHWLDWLDSIAPKPSLLREPDAANPLAVIHLLAYSQAEGLPWSHLILSGLNEGHWPPPMEPDAFLSEERLAELNREAIEQGRQGEGHVTVKQERAFLPGGYARREIQRRQFYNLVESASAGLAVTCALESEDDSGRALPASDFLSHLYFCAYGEPLTEARMQEARAHTRGWLDAWPTPPVVEPPKQPIPIEQTSVAFNTRRTKAPFGRFECAFENGAPPRAVQLSCKQWEQAVRNPASIWFAVHLGVAATSNDRTEDRWPITRGTWVHRWLADALCGTMGRFEQRNEGLQIIARIHRDAAATRSDIARAFTRAGRAEPQWWRARIAQAEWFALQFAGRMADLEGWPVAAAEWTLPKNTHVRMKAAALALRGRIDLLLAHEKTDGIPRTGWVIDFKTGQDKPLSDRTLAQRLQDGNGIQICLYALALAEAGAEQVFVSLLTPESNVEPQVGLESIRAQQSVWDALARMQQTGIFGIRGQMRAEYGPSLELPLATLPVEIELLEEKWMLTHPGLAATEETDDGE